MACDGRENSVHRCISIFNYNEEDTGAALAGQFPVEILDEECFIPLKHRIGNRKAPVEFIFDYYNVRHYLMLKCNEAILECVENECLRKVYDGLEKGDFKLEKQTVTKCLELFWPYVAEDFKVNHQRTARKVDSKERFKQKMMTRIQLKTVENGNLAVVPHKGELNHPTSYPIAIPCPEMPLFSKDEIC